MTNRRTKRASTLIEKSDGGRRNGVRTGVEAEQQQLA